MSITIGYRTLCAFAAGVAACVIVLFTFQAMSADAAPGDADTTFVAITPCRLMDTRLDPKFHLGPHDTFGAEDTQTIPARGTNGKCTLPVEAVGLSLNVTALNASAPSFVTIWPDGERPRAASLNPAPGQPPTPNAVTTNLSSAGSFRIFNNAGSVDVVVDVNGFYTNTSLRGLDDRLVALENALAALEAKTAAISIEDAGSTLRFTGVNVQIVDGSGDTGCSDLGQFLEDCNGFGNLIVGYNEVDTGPKVRSGSHNIVTGTDNDYTSHSGIVAGQSNVASGEYATITGGTSNIASGYGSSVSGGANNVASGGRASVSGGDINRARGTMASVSGGTRNDASGYGASVSGGMNNVASGGRASVSGGDINRAGGDLASVSGGSSNTASGNTASVSGGRGNTADGEFYASVSGGQSNRAGGNFASVSGGQGNIAVGDTASVSGGQSNTAGGNFSSVSGGDSGEASGDYSVVVGGSANLANGPRAVVVGGGDNVASGSKAVVSGGNARSSTSTFDWRAGTLFENE